MNKLVTSLLRITLNILDQSDRATADMRDRVKDRVEDLSDRVEDLTARTRQVITGQQNNFLRFGLSFAAGIGVGVGVGLLLAPASGEDTRNSINDKVQDASTRVRERFSGATAREAV
ncbi:MAG: YtxH domain-containing protein [Terriglobales bacterium]